MAFSSDGSDDGLVDGVDVGEGLSSFIMVYLSSSKLVLDDGAFDDSIGYVVGDFI